MQLPPPRLNPVTVDQLLHLQWQVQWIKQQSLFVAASTVQNDGFPVLHGHRHRTPLSTRTSVETAASELQMLSVLLLLLMSLLTGCLA